MTAQKVEESELVADQVETLNEVRLLGHVSREPMVRDLTTGDSVLNVRLKVFRPPGRGTERQSYDLIECAVWSSRLRKTVAKWGKDDVVEVAGMLQCRYFKLGGATVSRVEVDLESARLIRRAKSG